MKKVVIEICMSFPVDVSKEVVIVVSEWVKEDTQKMNKADFVKRVYEGKDWGEGARARTPNE